MRVPDLGAHAEERLELLRARSVDRDEAEFEVEHLHEGVRGLHDVSEELPFRNRRVHAGLERLVQLRERLEPRPRLVLPPPAAQCRLREADERSRMERPLEERDIAERLQEAQRRGIALDAAASLRQQDERKIGPFGLFVDPLRQSDAGPPCAALLQSPGQSLRPN